MLTAAADRYLALRRGLGHRLVQTGLFLRSFTRFAEDGGDTHVHSQRVLEWAVATGSTPLARGIRLRTVARFAAFLHAEDPKHELPPAGIFPTRTRRQPPYIYTSSEIGRLLDAAGQLHRTYPLRRSTYIALVGLIACTGLRISEALGLRMLDIEPDCSTILVRMGKFGKSRRVPLHPTAADALGRYVASRRDINTADQHLFLSAGGRRISRSMANYTFRTIARNAGIDTGRARSCRIHDLRHTFATRSLERCAADSGSVAEHFVALSTYMGHADIKHTYWYFEATPELMAGMAQAAESTARKMAT